ncbi:MULTISPECIES: methionine--tRNA ligase [Pyrobaculum]|uniref:Methionine--tRNA ligase n=1 Tax=Pyrobaculum arsenaticum (strain DSM 13514 / JCM 11321 / PZ6) TaxID=340102 RepID=SYM_PYRAR|nr:methionine--tRNA ligase [Pyrobaculum arsenaticum]A4WKG3.1 RecName: Full=Methionine--tRNA ligase; AltName: Full=Methionyl-tRNA synthetase; Short=MetRS [Pyrobaculum arsenaticum DSM 13514]ABP50880.1 methionyl-tRNA synthetase [Pyrobaculum arsenaticum DSM 13514]MCY0891332.1 methionine--tRNA ligase [Pyrobaculum arsenaticum]
MAKYVVGSAWPYVQTVPHLGNMIGSVLSADVYARYLRLRGHEVVFVSGSDMHGTPIEVEAIQLGVDPADYALKMHQIVAELFRRWDISFDLYTHTHSETHIKFVQEFFARVYENGFIFTRDDEVPYCPRDKIYLPDRFVIGKCPYCGYERARGDQCENCGRLLDPKQLIEPRCAVCGSKPEWRVTRHWYLDLRRLEDRIRKYVEGNPHLPLNAKEMSLAMLKEGMRPRAITRDNKWGIPAPFPGAEGKTIYVWFEAVLGYISAVVEYFKKLGREEEWKRFWLDQETKVVFFVGKDNVPFHVIILPALLMASGENYVMPTTTASTEYLLYEGDKFSKSRRWGIWIDEALHLLPTDYWRFVLVYIRPENRDTSFTWQTALEVINKVLNDDVGNYANRVLSFIKSRMGGAVPPPGKPSPEDEEFISKVAQLFQKAEAHYDAIELKEAVHTVVEIAREGNKYLNARAPWELAKKDAEAANAVLYRAFWSLKYLAAGLAPVVPRSAETLWAMMGISTPLTWEEAKKPPTPGAQLGEVKPLFRKITEQDVKVLLAKLEELRAQKYSRKYPWEQVLL